MDKMDDKVKEDYYDSDFKMTNNAMAKSSNSEIQVEDL